MKLSPKHLRYARLWVTAAATCLLAAGCATSKQNAPRYAWQTAQEEEYKAAFRSRWWSYYDRGMWNELRGNYAAAEKDLATARDLRSKDQLWPRTYGMHFLPEYFPSRELGITYYRQGRFEEGLQLLETSLNDQFSSRATYYADLARVQVLTKNGLDKEPPSVELTSPTPGQSLGAIYTTVSGITRDDQFVKAIYVNDKSIDFRQSLPEVPFKYPVVFSAGKNEVRVRVVDLMGKSTEKTFEFTGDHEGPILSFDRFDTAAGVLSGVTYDAAGVVSLSLYGAPVSLQRRPDGIYEFRIPVNVASQGASVPYACTDRSGNTTAGIARIDAQSSRVAIGDLPRTHLAMAADARTAALTAGTESTSGTFTAELQGIDDGQRFYQPQILVNIAIASPEPVSEVIFNDEHLDILPARSEFTLSKSVALGNEPTSMRCRLEAHNKAGGVASNEKTVRREPSALESADSKLSFEWLRTIYSGLDLSPEEVTNLLSPTEIQDLKLYKERFGTFFERDSAALEKIAVEQFLSQQLAAKKNQLMADGVEVADVLLEATVNTKDDFIEIILAGTSTSNGDRIVNRVEIAEQFDKNRLAEYREKIVARLAQEFPRIKRPLLQMSGQQGVVGWSSLDGIRRSFSCILVKKEEIQGLPHDKVLAQGLVTGVPKSDQQLGDAKFRLEDGFVLDADLSKYFVITK
jgi:tetratricopeptide (TPR) repeat protein